MLKINTSESRAATAAASITNPPELPAEIAVLQFAVLVDTREQHPWTFQGLAVGGKNPARLIVPRKVATLETGDYSIECRHSNRFCIERKSASDLIGSVGGGHARFEREHERMAVMIAAGGAACVIVEGSLSAILDELRTDGRESSRRTLLGCVASWPFRFGVPWLFAGDRRTAEELAILILTKWFERLVVDSVSVSVSNSQDGG